MYRLMQPSDWAEVLALWQAQRGDTEEFVRGAVERFAGVQNVYVAEENDHIEAVALAVPVTLQGRPGSYLFGLCGQGSLLLAGLVDTLCAQQKLRGAGFVVAVPASPEQSTLLQDKGFQKAFKIKSPSRVMKEQGGFISQGLFDGIGDLWKKVSQKFKGFKDGVVNFFTGKNGVVSKVTGLGGKIVTGLKNGLKNLKATFTNAFKGPLNGVIKLVNNMVGKINDKLLISVGSTLSKVLSALGVSVTNGQYQLFSIPTIPELEKGGVLKKGQVGLLEGKGAEAVVPLERNTQWISKVAAMMVQMLGSSGQAVNVTIPVYVGGKHLSTVVLDDVNQTEKKGRDPVTATA